VLARLLGPLEIEHAGRPVPLGGRAPRALVARLLLDPGRAVPVNRLVEDLWGERAPASAVKMIQIHVSALRKVLPEGVLVTRSPGYALEIEPEAVDLARFERLRREGQDALAAGSPARAAERLREAAASLAKVLRPVADCLGAHGEVLALVKPQFELGRGRARGGVVRSATDRREALLLAGRAAEEAGLVVRGFAPSGLAGPKGNLETFMWCALDGEGVGDLEAAIAAAEPEERS
jgi:hypothetical protein